MKNIAFLLTIFLFSACVKKTSDISVEDYKTKNEDNSIERTEILDGIRAELYKEYNQEFVFVVKKLNVSSEFAWFEGNAERRDKGDIAIEKGEKCCGVEALLKKYNGKWRIIKVKAFTSRIWWDNLWKETGAPKEIFTDKK